MKTTLLSLGLALTATATTAHADPNPNQVYVESLSYGGTGCPQGSVAATVSADAQLFEVLFDNYAASVGPAVNLTESRKNCLLELKLHVPEGWAYGIESVEYHGVASLDPQVTGIQKTSYFFAGHPQSVSAQTVFAGPYESDFDLKDVFPTEGLVFSDCHAQSSLNISSQVRLNNGGHSQSSGFIALDDITAGLHHRFNQVYHLGWQRCQ